MKPYYEGTTLWVPARLIAREFHKTPQTIRRWCDSGFILTLGYRTMRDPQGHWFLSTLSDSPVKAPVELRAY